VCKLIQGNVFHKEKKEKKVVNWVENMKEEEEDKRIFIYMLVRFLRSSNLFRFGI
jgi:hypothetical protein